MARLCSLGRWFASALALIASAGCEEGPVTTATRQVEDVWSFAQAVMNQGPLLVEINGTPYGEESQRLAVVVLQSLTQAIRWSKTVRFTTDPLEAGSHTMRLVMTFNGPDALSSRDQCASLAEGGGPWEDGGVRVLATFCDEGSPFARVSGLIKRSQGVDDWRFAALIRQVALDMFGQRRAYP